MSSVAGVLLMYLGEEETFWAINTLMIDKKVSQSNKPEVTQGSPLSVFVLSVCHARTLHCRLSKTDEVSEPS